jgi:hypothetical protein
LTSLQWTPVFDSIISIGGQCNLLIAPFIQTDALRALLKHFDNSKLQVVSSWTASSLASGVSDPDVYAVLKEMDVPLYINADIHLKLFIFEDDVAFHTSANITAKGLGLGSNSNIEIGCKLSLALNDWLRINDLLETSHRVTDVMYAKAKCYVDENKNRVPPLPPLVLPSSAGPHPFSRQSLPQCDSPSELWEFYRTGLAIKDSRSACMHDLWLYKITNSNLSRDQFFQQLGDNFRSHPFVQSLLCLLKDRGVLRFGAVNAWITSNCSDRPTPSRWEVKPATKRLYDWLTFFVSQISWSQPNHTQVISWKP